MAAVVTALTLAAATPAAAQVTRVSVATDGSEANGASTKAVISGNGRFVAFASIRTRSRR